MKLKELCEAMKPIPSDYDVEYDKITQSIKIGQYKLPSHLRHLHLGGVKSLTVPELKQELAKLTDLVLIRLLYIHPTYLQYITNPSSDVIKFALRHDGLNIKYLTKMGIPVTGEYINIAVRSNGKAIGWVDNPTEDQMMRAVSKTSTAIHNIIKPYSKKLTPGVLTPAVLAVARRKNPNASAGMLVKHGKLTDDETIAAIKAAPHNVLHIKNPTTEQVELALKLQPTLITSVVNKGLPISDDTLREVTIHNPIAIRDIARRASYQLSPTTIKTALTNQRFIDMPIERWGDYAGQYPYDITVKLLFKNNAVLAKKWIRYGETMRTN